MLAPTQAAKPVLRGEHQVMMREEVVSRATGARSSTKKKITSDLSDEAQRLFDQLRTWRLEEAREQGVPPYVVFGDVTLRALAEHRPVTPEKLLEISGIGKAKLERYGDAVIEIIERHQAA